MTNQSKLFFLLFAVLSTASICPNKDTILPGNLGRISDGVVATCTPFDAEEHQCIVLTNPWTRQLRVFDVTQNQFVLSPTGYFPLAIKVGNFTNRLAAHPSSPFVYGLDPLSGVVYTAKTRGDNNFGKSDLFPVNRKNAVSIVAVSGQTGFWTALAFDNIVSAFPVDAASGMPTPPNDPAFGVGTGTRLSDLAIDRSNKWMVASDAGSNQAFVFSVANWLSVKNAYVPAAVNVGGPSSRAFVGSADLGNGDEPIAIVLRQDAYKAVFVRLNDLTQTKEVAFDSLPLVAYIADSASQPCCEKDQQKETAWALVLTSSGNAHYVSLKTNQIAKTIELGSKKRFSNQAAYAAAILGPLPGNPNDAKCPRKLYLAFGGGLLASMCEGKDEAIRLDRLE